MSTATRPPATGGWLLQTQALAILEVSPRKLRELADRGFITTRAIPGTYVRYRETDLRSLAERFVRPATRSPNSAA